MVAPRDPWCVCCCYFRYNQAISMRLLGETATLGHREVVERCRCAHGAQPPVNHQTKLVSIFRRPTELDCKRYGLPKSHQEDSYGLTKSAKKTSEFHSYSGKTVAGKDASVYHNNRNDRAYDGLRPYLLLPLLR